MQRRRPDVRDDARHPTLRRARSLGQLHIDALDRGPGRSRYGAVEVKDAGAKSALNEFRGMPGDPAWSLNPYVGCQHACTYCYVPKTLHAQRERWGDYVLVKTDLPHRLAKEIPRRERRRVYLSTGTDAYQSVEAEHHVTRRCLEVLARHDWPVDVLTRSPLVLRDVDLLGRFSDLRVGLSIPTLDDAVRAVVEPQAPPVEARLRALQALARAGLTTYANLAPAYPLTRDITPAFVAETLRDAGARWVNVSPWRYLGEILPPLRRRLREADREELEAYIRDPEWQRRMVRAYQVAFDRAGIPLHRGFFNPPGAFAA